MKPTVFRALILGVFLAGALACNRASSGLSEGPVVETATALPATSTAQPELPVTSTAQPELPPTSLPTGVTEAAAPLSGATQAVQFGDVSFGLPAALGRGAQGASVPASLAGDPNAPYWEVYPTYMKIELVGYPLADTFHKPQILIYPAEEYAALSEQAAQRIADLKTLLADPAADPKTLPFLPVWNAAQVFHARTEPLSFFGGRGVRYLSMYSQAPLPVNNNELFYTFQGLTDDGKTYVAVILPISMVKLPADAQMAPDEFNALAEHYEAYLFQTVELLNTEPAESFTPGLAVLDDLVKSIRVTRP